MNLHWNVAEAYHMINESIPTPRYVLPLIYLMFFIDNGEITLLKEKKPNFRISAEQNFILRKSNNEKMNSQFRNLIKHI